MAANPKLAALFDNLLSEDENEHENGNGNENENENENENKNKNKNKNEDEDEDENEDKDEDSLEEEMEEVLPKNDDDENQPLFENSNISNNDLVNDMEAYMVDDDDDEDAAINQVITRIYDKNDTSEDTFQEIESSVNDNSAILSLQADDYFNLWLSRVPDAFMYLHSFNDEYKAILKRVIDETDIEQISKDLQSIRKQFGKTNEGDELTLEALKFQESFLECTYSWKEQKNTIEQIVLNSPASIQPTEENIIVDDNEEDEDIQFIDASFTNANDTRIIEAREPSNHVHLDIQQSSLHSTAPANCVESVNSNISNNVETVNNMSTAHSNSVGSVSNSSSPNNTTEEAFVKEAINENDLNEEALIQEAAKEEAITDKALNGKEEIVIEDQGYNSEDEAPDVQGEEDEYARFVSDIASKKLEDVRSELYEDLKDLNKQQRKELGNADDVTDQMVRDIQELLKLFGIPYLVSPMEAEAQCATLEAMKLVDGTVTDDSDVFLFGASRVYKNMFNQQRFVECYLAQDVEREMLLTRKKLIQLAFLLGSDYTEGIPGVGPVAAMEILSEFSEIKEEDEEKEEPLEAPLKRFKDWYNKGIDDTAFQRKFVCMLQPNLLMMALIFFYALAKKT